MIIEDHTTGSIWIDLATKHRREKEKREREKKQKSRALPKIERYFTKEERSIRVKSLAAFGAKFGLWTEQNKPKGNKKGSYYMIDIYKE